MSFGIAIPTCKKHLNYLEELLESIEASSVPPDIVSISCSEVEDSITLKRYSFEIILTTTQEYKTAGQNRNIAASKLSTDIISFIDSDDISTSFRNEYLIRSFKNKEVKGIVHNFSVFSYTTGVIEDKIKRSPLMLEINYLNLQRKNMAFPINNRDLLVKQMACGHITIRKEIFDLFKYNESKKRTQDVEFVQRVVLGGLPLSYISNKLSYYRNDDLFKLLKS
jgi:hypothetical protein